MRRHIPDPLYQPEAKRTLCGLRWRDRHINEHLWCLSCLRSWADCSHHAHYRAFVESVIGKVPP